MLSFQEWLEEAMHIVNVSIGDPWKLQKLSLMIISTTLEVVEGPTEDVYALEWVAETKSEKETLAVDDPKIDSTEDDSQRSEENFSFEDLDKEFCVNLEDVLLENIIGHESAKDEIERIILLKGKTTLHQLLDFLDR